MKCFLIFTLVLLFNTALYAQNSRSPYSENKTKTIKGQKSFDDGVKTSFFIPKGYTYPKGRYPEGQFSVDTPPKRDFGGKKLTIKKFEKVLKRKRKEFYKRRKKNRKIDKKISKKMEKEWFFILRYGFIPSKKEIKRNHL